MRLPDFSDLRILSPRIGQCLLVLGLVLLAWGGGWALDEAGRARQLADEVAEARHMVQANAAAGRHAVPAAEVRDAPAAGGTRSRELSQWLEVDWSARLAALEHRFGAGIALLGFRLDAQKGALELRGEAPSLARIEALREDLAGSGLRRVSLARHESLLRDARRSEAFTLLLEWP